MSEELDSIELEDISGEDVDGVNLADFGEIDLEVDKPHIKIETSELRNCLSVAKNVASVSGRDVVSKSICMREENGELKLYATDFDVFLEYNLDLLNEENILDDVLVIPLDILQKVLKAAPSSTIIYKSDEDEYQMKVVGGDMVLETNNVSADKFIFDKDVKKESTVKESNLYDVIKNFGDIASSAVSPTERRIVCNEDGAFANYMWAIIKSDSQFVDMDIKVKDIKVLKSLIEESDDILNIYKTVGDVKVERKIIEGDKFKYSFLVSNIQISQSLVDDMDEVLLDNGVYVDYSQLYKTVELAAGLPYSVGKVDINFTDTEELKLVIKTKSKKDSVFNIAGSVSGNVSPLKGDLTIQAKLFKILLKSFSESNTLKISLSESGIGLYSEKFKASIYTEVE